MATSPLYIRAAEEGRFDACNSQHRAPVPPFHALGVEAVHNSGYKYRRFATAFIHKGRDPVATACYLLASMPDSEILHLLSIVNPNVPVSTCIASLTHSSSSAFSGRLEKYYQGLPGIKASTKRKVAEISTDILFSFSYAMVICQSIQFEQELQDRSQALLRTHKMAMNALNTAEASAQEWVKKDNAIMALLAVRTGAEESPVHTDDIVDVLGDQLGLKTNYGIKHLESPRSSILETTEDNSSRYNVAMLLEAAAFIES